MTTTAPPVAYRLVEGDHGLSGFPVDHYRAPSEVTSSQNLPSVYGSDKFTPTTTTTTTTTTAAPTTTTTP